MEIEAKVLVPLPVALGFSKHPEHVQECRTQAEAAMNNIASARNRRVCSMPRLVDSRQSSFGPDVVELIFRADTRSS